jgi:hypothetical protein
MSTTSNMSPEEERSLKSMLSTAYTFFTEDPVGIALKDKAFAYVSSRDISPEDDRAIFAFGEKIREEWDKTKESSFGASRDISPSTEEERKVMLGNLTLASWLIQNSNKLINAMKGSRDLSSGNVSAEDQQRWVSTALAIGMQGYKIYKDNPEIATKAWNFAKSLF